MIPSTTTRRTALIFSTSSAVAILSLFCIIVQTSNAQGPPNPILVPASARVNKRARTIEGLELKDPKKRRDRQGKYNLRQLNNAATFSGNDGNGKSEQGVAGIDGNSVSSNVGGKHHGGASLPLSDKARKDMEQFFPNGRRAPRYKPLTPEAFDRAWELKDELKIGSAASGVNNGIAVNRKMGNDQVIDFRGNVMNKKRRKRVRENAKVTIPECANARSYKNCKKAFFAAKDVEAKIKETGATESSTTLNRDGEIDLIDPKKGNRVRKFTYKVSCEGGNCRNKRGRRRVTKATLKELGKRTQYDCEAQETGVTKCEGEKKTPEVIVDEDGNVSIKKNNVKIAEGKCKETRRGSKDYKCTVGTVKQFDVQASKMRATSGATCADESKDKVIEVSDYTFEPSKKSFRDGSTEYVFPGCFDISANIKVLNPKRVDLEDFGRRVAFEFVVSITGYGRLNCKDSAVCRLTGNDKDCYYCNMCALKRNRKSVGRYSATTACEKDGQDWSRKQRVSATVCPPAQDAAEEICLHSNKFGDYSKKKGDIDVKLLVYVQNKAKDPKKFATRKFELYNEFLKRAGSKNNFIDRSAFALEKGTLEVEKKSKVGEWTEKLGNSGFSGTFNSIFAQTDNSNMWPWYVAKKLRDERLPLKGKQIHCSSWTQAFVAGKEGKALSFFVEAATETQKVIISKKWTDYFKQAECKDYDRFQKELYAEDQRAADEANSGRGGGILGNLFGGRG